MSNELDVVVVGAGQAGLTASYLLQQRKINHVVLERGKIGESWRSQRWDSFYLNTPNWINSLPGMELLPDDPDGFGSRDDLVAYFNRYASSFDLPVREHISVNSLDRDPVRFRIGTNDGTYQSKAIILANGGMTEPKLPVIADDFPKDVLVVSAATYKNPSALPEGAVLVIGTGQSGCQIAEDLLGAGRRVYVCASKVARSPRIYRGKDTLYWMKEIGALDIKLEDLEDPAMQFAAQPQVSGTEGGHTVSLQSMARDGATLLGRAVGIEGDVLKIRTNLHECIDFADRESQKIKEGIDKYIQTHGIRAEPARPDPGEPELPDLHGSDQLEELDLMAADIHSAIFCTGFHGDWGWVNLDFLDERGSPVHEGGITPVTGLYCLGYPWLSKRKSGILCGVEEDAQHVVSHLNQYLEASAHTT
jgi:putative flavoprotein involved in K+ transport